MNKQTSNMLLSHVVCGSVESACSCMSQSPPTLTTQLSHAIAMEGPQASLEHSKSPDVIDTATSGFPYNSFAGLDYLQYPPTEAFSPYQPFPSLGFPNLEVLL